tara:strand:+ start:1376 stop:1738 length:363 start_codon:yes stop_codon:yes gene_type:complete
MGYDMSTLKSGDYYRANITGMQLLLECMFDAGVDLEKKKPRTWGSEGYAAGERELVDCFCSNDGWLIEPADCREIGKKVNKYVTELGREHFERFSGDYDFIKGFAEYCEDAAGDGGFEVW